jgi:hypothetical protein
VSPFVDVLVVKGVKLTVQRLDVTGGEIGATGRFANSNQPSITARYPFRQATQLAADFDRSLSRSKRLAVKGSLTKSDLNDFTLIRLQARLELSSLWSVQSELQLVEAGDPTVNNRNEIAEFRNNDRLQVGLGYVF